MKILKENEQKTFEQLVSLTQGSLKKVMSKFVRSKYGNKNVIETKDYICVRGEIPIALVAHMDTVFDKPVKDMFYDTKKNVIWSPQGLGADDRAGIYAIIRIVNSGLKPHVILTTDEESGCIGAGELAKIECPFEDLKYMIELDRRGTNDCVFYDCDNTKFVEYVESFGFTEAFGTYSDICELCPDWGVAGVNLSIGYVDEHSHQELLYVSPMLATIEKVKKMLQVEEIPAFEYIPSPYAYNWKMLSKGYGKYYSGYDWDITTPSAAGAPAEPAGAHITAYGNSYYKCHVCGKVFWEEEMFPVKMIDGSTDFYCTDCIVDNVGWCNVCNEPFEIDPQDKTQSIDMCLDCVLSGAENKINHYEAIKQGAV